MYINHLDAWLSNSIEKQLEIDISKKKKENRKRIYNPPILSIRSLQIYIYKYIFNNYLFVLFAKLLLNIIKVLFYLTMILIIVRLKIAISSKNKYKSTDEKFYGQQRFKK